MEILGRTGVDKTCVGWRLLEVENPMRNQRAKQPSGPAYTTVTYAPFRGRIYTCILFLKNACILSRPSCIRGAGPYTTYMTRAPFNILHNETTSLLVAALVLQVRLFCPT
jgi:hypothetical protein